MAIVRTDNQHYGAIAAAIRSKNGRADTYKPSQMAAAILELGVGRCPHADVLSSYDLIGLPMAWTVTAAEQAQQ